MKGWILLRPVRLNEKRHIQTNRSNLNIIHQKTDLLVKKFHCLNVVINVDFRFLW